MTQQASETIASRYQADGYVAPVDVLAPDEVRRFRQEFDRLEEREGREKTQAGIQNWHTRERFIWEMATHPRLLDVIEQITGPDILLFNTRFICKYADPDARFHFAWHQDIPYWGVQPETGHTVWLAVDDADVENGCMRVIPGSHEGAIVDHYPSGRDGNMLRMDQSIPSELVKEETAVDLVLRAGQASIHHAKTFHASNPNTSARRRCGFLAQYLPPDVRQSREYLHAGGVSQVKWKPWRVTLVRGVDRHGNFERDEAPFPLP